MVAESFKGQGCPVDIQVDRHYGIGNEIDPE